MGIITGIYDYYLHLYITYNEKMVRKILVRH